MEGNKKSCCCYINSRRKKEGKSVLAAEWFSYHGCRWGWDNALFSIKNIHPVFVCTDRIRGEEEQPVVGEAKVRELLKSWLMQSPWDQVGCIKGCWDMLDIRIATLYHLWKSIEIRGVSQWLENGKWSTCLQQGQEVLSTELQAGQLHFGPWRNHETSPLGSQLWACKASVVDWK